MTMRIGRRDLLLTGAALVLAAAIGASPAFAEDAEASAFLKTFAEQMAAIVVLISRKPLRPV